METVPTPSLMSIDERYLDTVVEHDPLGALADSSHAWDREPVALPVRLSAALWSIAGADVLVGCWAAAVFTGFWPCAGALGWLTTLGHHPGLLAVLCAACVLTVATVALMTGGLARANAWQLAVLVLAGIVGVGCLLGPVLVLAVVAVVVAIVGYGVLFVVERF